MRVFFLKTRKYILTGLVVLLAVALLVFKYWDYINNPWTRDGQVCANVIQITPRVSGPIVKLAVKDNQFVKAGDLLFEIDPRTFQAALAQARAKLDKSKDDYQAKEKQVEAALAQVEVSRAALHKAKTVIRQINAEIEKNQAEFERQKKMLPQRATSKKLVERAKANYEISVEKWKGSLAQEIQAKASLNQAIAVLAEARANLGAQGAANASIRQAQAELRQAELNLEFTKIKAPADGYITNLDIKVGSNVVANQPALALVDVNSFWVYGFFKETSIGNMSKDNKAIVTLMGYPDRPIEGKVESLAWGIAQEDGATGSELLPNVNPTYEWIRLAQRIPVRIHLDKIPQGIELRVGMTASVLVKTGTTKLSTPKRGK